MANCSDPQIPDSVRCSTTGFYNSEQRVVLSCPDSSITPEAVGLVRYGEVLSFISQEDADTQAYNRAEQLAVVARTASPCVFENDEVSYTATCPSPSTESLSVTIPAGTFTSFENKDDANLQALEAAIDEAESGLSCQYPNTEQSYTASCGSPKVGTPVTSTVPAGTYFSFTSQSEANATALAAAQSAAERQLVCAWVNEAQSYTAYCPDGEIGSPSSYTAEAGTFGSLTSLENANANALTFARLQAIQGLSCVWENTEQTFIAVCPGSISGGVVVPPGSTIGSPASATVAAGEFISTISQGDADAQALAAAQVIASAALSCHWVNAPQTATDTCGYSDGSGGLSVTIPVNTFSSSVSQADANALALLEAEEEVTALLSGCLHDCNGAFADTSIGQTDDIHLGSAAGKVSFTWALGNTDSTIVVVYDGVTVLNELNGPTGSSGYFLKSTGGPGFMTVTITNTSSDHPWMYTFSCPEDDIAYDTYFIAIGGTPTSVSVLVSGLSDSMIGLGYSLVNLIVVESGGPTEATLWVNTAGSGSDPGAPSGHSSIYMTGMYDSDTSSYFDGWIVYLTP